MAAQLQADAVHSLTVAHRTKDRQTLRLTDPGGNRVVFDFWNFISGLVAGAIGGSLLTFHLTKNIRADRHGTATDQSGARAGGDMVGRDKR